MSRVAAATIAALLLWSAVACSDGSNDAVDPSPATTSTIEDRSTDSTTGRAQDSTDPGPAPKPAPLTWIQCEGGLECAQLTVPLDHDDPNGRTITLGVARRPATDPDNRIGSLLVNPGGPGGSAVQMLGYLQLPRPLTERFDIVGVDPRGVGRSTPLTCNTHLQATYDADPTIDGPADREHLLATSADLIEECEELHGYMLPHLGSRAVAHDMDMVREALGDDKLTYIGYSYGTVIGQVYAQLHPDKVRALVLDGAVSLDQTGIEGATAQAAGFTRAIEAFIARCDDRGCGLDGPARDVIDEVMEASEERPIPARDADRPATPGVVHLALARALYHEGYWPQLADALQQARGGNADGLVRLADSYLNRLPDGSYEQGFEVYFAVNCLDWAWPDDPDELLAAGAALERDHPLFGEALINDYVRCTIWPTPADPLDPLSEFEDQLALLPPTVVISTTGDPATPYESGVTLAEELPGAVLVTNVGEGHTIFGGGKSCIDDPVTSYLIDLEPPAEGIRC